MRWFLARLEWQYQNVDDRDYYYVFYRAENIKDTRVFGNGACIVSRKSALSQEETENWIRKSIGRSSKRFWYPRDANFGIIFVSFNFADVEWRCGKRHPESVGFEWKLPLGVERFADWSQPDFIEFCEHLYADENSELNFALRWREKSAEARDIEAFKCENGDWENLRKLFSCAQKVITHYHGIFPWPKSDASYWDFDRCWSNISGATEPCADAIAWSNRWRAALCEIARPSFWGDKPICVYRWRHHDPERRELLWVSCTIPTHHEVLEAQLELREFLRPHLSDDEIEALMRPE